MLRTVRSLLRHAHAASWLASAFSVLALASVAGPVGAQEPAPGTPPYLYAAIQDEARVAVIDMQTLEVVRTIDLTELGFGENAKPHHVAVEPDGEHWYVSLIGENRVARFARGGELLGTFEMSTPGMLSYDADRGLLLASRSMSAVNPPTRVGYVNTRTMEGDEIDVFLPRPHPMAISPDGRWAYTGSLGVNQLAAIDLETEDVTLTNLDGPPHALVQYAISEDGHWLVASTEVSGRLLVFDRSENPAEPRQVASVEVGPMAFDPVFGPHGQEVWVPVKGANEIAIISVGDWTVRRRVQAESLLQPHQVVFSPDGSRAFVSNNNKTEGMAGMAGMHGDMHGEHGTTEGNVTVLDADTFEVLKVLPLGAYVTGMGTAWKNR